MITKAYEKQLFETKLNVLQDQPVVNAVIDDATNEIVYRDYVDISVAVATPKGLVVPVLRDCNDMNFKQIDEEMDKLAQKARNGKLSVEDMDGGTFTIRFVYTNKLT